jgi:hypothetical protein
MPGTNNIELNSESSKVNKDWFMRHLWFFIAITAVIVGAGIVVQVKIAYWRNNLRFDLPVHRELTAGWKTYTNTEYGFEFKYPPDLYTEEKSGLFIIKNSTLPEDQIYLGSGFFNDDGVEGKDWVKGYAFYVNPSARQDILVQDEEEHVAKYDMLGQDAYLLTCDCLHRPEVAIRNPNVKNSFVTFSHADGFDTLEESRSVQTLFDQILSTFKFTQMGNESSQEADSTAGWKTYTNAEYGFEFKYPKNWVLDEQSTNAEALLFRPPGSEGGNGFSLEIDKASHANVEDWFNEKMASDEYVDNKFSAMKIAGLDAISFYYLASIGGCDKEYAFIHEGNLYQLHRGSATCDLEDSIYDNIASTFKFTD